MPTYPGTESGIVSILLHKSLHAAVFSYECKVRAGNTLHNFRQRPQKNMNSLTKLQTANIEDLEAIGAP